MGSRAAGTMGVWRKWKCYHRDAAKKIREQKSEHHSGCGQSPHLSKERRKVLYLLVSWICSDKAGILAETSRWLGIRGKRITV